MDKYPESILHSGLTIGRSGHSRRGRYFWCCYVCSQHL